MRIPRVLLDQIVAHARREAPNECCGMVAARDGLALRVYECVNTAASPFRYELDPREQYRVEMEIDDAGEDLGAIYHSHTRSDPVPSQTDVNLAFHPHALYLIVGVAGPEDDVRAWRIADGAVTAVPFEVAEG